MTLPSKESVQEVPNSFIEEHFHTAEPYPGFAFISKQEHIAELWEGTRVVHLSGQSVINIRTIREVLVRCPQLAILQTPPSQGTRLIKRGVQDLLQEQGVAVQFGRTRDRKQYDEPPVSNQYLQKKAQFEAMRQDPDRNRLYEGMKSYEFDEALIADIYFRKEGVSIREIAGRMGFNQDYTRRKLAVLVCWTGFPLGEKDVQNGASYLSVRLSRLQTAEATREAREAYRKQFQVGNRLPPYSLPTQRWEAWQQIATVLQANPNILKELRDQDIRWYIALTAYFQLEEAEGIRQSLREVGKQFEVTSERVRQLKNKALHFLGLPEEGDIWE